MVFHHGAGYSALSFAMMAKEITKETGGECGVLSLDCRRHGACVCVLSIMDYVVSNSFTVTDL